MVCEMVLTEYKKRLVCVCIFIFCFISRFPYRKINVNKIKYVMDSQNRAMDMRMKIGIIILRKKYSVCFSV